MTMSKMIKRTSLPHPEVMPKWLEGVYTSFAWNDELTFYTNNPEGVEWYNGDTHSNTVKEFSFNIEQAYEKHPEMKDDIDYVLGREEYTTEVVEPEYNKDVIDEKVVALKYNPENVMLENKTQAVSDNNRSEAIIGKIKSTGGSSDYYKLTIHTASGETFQCEVGDVIQAMVGDNFQLGNVLKASRRMWLDAQGGGKEGVDMDYDRAKIHYFSDDFVQRYGSKQ